MTDTDPKGLTPTEALDLLRGTHFAVDVAISGGTNVVPTFARTCNCVRNSWPLSCRVLAILDRVRDVPATLDEEQAADRAIESSRGVLALHRDVETAPRDVCPECQFETPAHPIARQAHAPGCSAVTECARCGHVRDWHRVGKCAGDFLHCRCPGFTASASPSTEPETETNA